MFTIFTSPCLLITSQLYRWYNNYKTYWRQRTNSTLSTKLKVFKKKKFVSFISSVMAEVETNHQHKQGKFIKINRGLKQNRKSRSMTFKRLHVLVLYKTLSLLFLIPSKP